MPLPKLAWTFNGTLTDYVQGISFSGTPVYSTGKYAQGLSVIDSASYSTGTLPTASNIVTTNGLTVCVWARITAGGGASLQGYNKIIIFVLSSSVNNTIGNTNPLVLALGFYNGWKISYFYNDPGNGYRETDSTVATLNTWYHLCVVFGGSSNKTMTFYINGVSQGSPVAYTTDMAGTTAFNSIYNYGVTNNTYTVSDSRIYNTALTSTQVQSIYNQQGIPGMAVVQALKYTNITAPTLYSFSSQIFSNAQATSNLGPTQSQLNTIYPSLAPTYLTSNTGIQTWTVPVTGTYSLVAAGAAGGTASAGGGTAGRGVIVGCQAIFQKNQVISIIVGQSGVSAALQTTSNIGGGGGGGSFIVDYSTGYLYIAAGGGGGADAIGSQGGTPSGFDASFGQDGVNGTGSGSGVNTSPGGTGGNGGTSFPYGGSNGNAGGGGGGFYTNGGQSPSGQMGQGGFAVLNGAQGGLSGNTLNFTNSFGGFGSGGGGGGNSQVIINNGAGGGGGGGYSGGGAGSRSGLGAGGGGSYVPLGQTMTQIGYCTSNGYVSINYIAPVAVKLTGTPLFTQLSPSATSSAVGAFSLRAVNGTSVKAVNVAPGGTFPPSAMTPPLTYTNSSTQTLGTGKLNGSYTASSSSSAYGTEPACAFRLFDNFGYAPYVWQVSTYPAGGGTVSTPTTTTTGATNYNGEWLQFQTPFPINLTSYSAYMGFLSSFVLLGSTTGATSSWTLIDSQSGIVSTAVTKAGLNFVGYSYFRFVIITATQAYPVLGNVRFNGTVPSLAQDFYADRLGNLLTAPVTGQSLANWLGGATGYVTTWYDQSGKGNHMSCSSNAIQPKINPTNGWIDFKTSAYFDTSANPASGPVPWDSTKNYTVTCHHNIIGNADGGICETFSTDLQSCNAFIRISAIYDSYWLNNDNDHGGGSYSVGNRVTFKWDGTNRYIYTNGSLQSTQLESGSWGQNSSGTQKIGYNSFANQTMNGEMYSIFMFNTSLSDVDRNFVENFS